MKYRPSNGSEGADFCERWCANCVHDNYDMVTGEGESCEILMRTLVFDLDDSEYPEEWQREPGQAPRCTAFHDRNDESLKQRCPDTPDMFEQEPKS